ncbi:MAG TPA: complex I subunit 5 family protein [Caldisericia bacterium]|nr:complex I subunit 5 family protein [Caldisericia bacterium]
MPFLSLSVNPYTLAFVVLTIPPWLSAFIYSLQYIHQRKSYFYSFFALTFLSNLMIFFSSNLLSLLVFFEWMSIFSFLLVIYDRKESAMKAGKLYLTFSLFSGLFILAGILLGTHPILRPYAVWVLSLGFLIKCGAFPFHVWLPEAHPVAPAPASAILSGCIIKVGFYGMMQILVIYHPKDFGYGIFIIVIALITMLIGVIQALVQAQAKKMLAYHSVSQMGYILLGLGLFLITHSDVALLGAILHAMNHAYFKSALFLSIGAVGQEAQQSSVDMYKIKGFFQRSPWLSICFLVAVLGISGAPFFNGFVSKTLLHEELIHSHHPFAFFKQIETLFMITAIGTFVSNFKMFYLINRYDNKIKIQWKNFSILKFAPLAFLAILILLFGLHPVFYEKIIPEVLKHSGQELFEGVSPFHHLFNHGLPGFFTIEFIGIMVIYFGLKTGIFHIKLPHIILYSWYHIYQQLENFFRWNLKKSEIFVVGHYMILQRLFNSLFLKTCQKVDDKIICTYGNASRVVDNVFSASSNREGSDALRYNDFIEKYGKVLVIWLMVLILLATILFVWIYLGYFT